MTAHPVTAGATTGSCLCGGITFRIHAESSPGKERAFCGRCGSPLFSRRAALPGVVRVRVGLLDEPVNARPAWHAHTESKSSWWPILDGLPQYPGDPAPRSGV